jgi:putative tricarboxylic transport membrane protein
MKTGFMRSFGAVLAAALVSAWPTASQAWQPTKTVEFIVPAGIGGGAGQMAQLIQGIVQKHHLMPTSMVVISKKGGSGAEGFLYVKHAQGDPHKIIITLSNLFTTPLATGSPFSWSDYTPIAMMALDEFVFWVNAKTPYMTPAERFARSWSAGTSIRASTTRSNASRTGARAPCGRFASSTKKGCLTPRRSPAASPGRTSQPASRRDSISST